MARNTSLGFETIPILIPACWFSCFLLHYICCHRWYEITNLQTSVTIISAPFPVLHNSIVPIYNPGKCNFNFLKNTACSCWLVFAFFMLMCDTWLCPRVISNLCLFLYFSSSVLISPCRKCSRGMPFFQVFSSQQTHSYHGRHLTLSVE